MGDSIPGNDDNTVDNQDGHVDDTTTDRDLPTSVGNDGESESALLKPVTEPPPPSPPLLPGQQPDETDEIEAGEAITEDSADVSEWLMGWAEEQTEAVDEARTTRKIPAIDPHEPPATKAIIEGLKRTADTGEATPTIEPDRSDFIGRGESTPPAPEKLIVPRPPQVRTPPAVTGPVPPEVERDSLSTWSPAATADAPLIDLDGTSVRPEVTENDIARFARTTSTSVITARTVKLGGVDVTFGSQRSLAVVGTFAMTLLVALIALAASGLGVDRTSNTSADGLDISTRNAAVLDDDDDLLTAGTSPAGPDTSELARSTVRVVGLDDEGEPVCSGSGVLVHEVGVILTNSHVVPVGDDCAYSSIGVAVLENTSAPAELLYLAEVLVKDDDLDLAVLQIVGPLPGLPAPFPRIFPAASLGDSDQVQLGDDIQILGFPVIGGDTITSTAGLVSGFSSQIGLGDRALIKTDASISAGNSGGMAVNEAGQVIGIPTRARATESGPAIDCRPQEDTNGDGVINDEDNCIPVGGFLNGIRPINLAADILRRADAIRYADTELPPATSTFDLSGVLVTNPRFSIGESENKPTEIVLAAPQGATEICLFVDWTGIPNGMPWSAVWLVDGERVGEFGRLDQMWDYGETGRNFWYCAKDENGHRSGTYEVGLFLDNQLIFVESIVIVEDDADIYEVTWVNKSDQEICGLAVNPLADNRHVGLNELEADIVIGVGQSHTLELAAGVVVVEAFDCSGRAIAVELDGLRIPEDMFVDGEEVPFVIGGPEDDRPADGGG